MGLCIRLLAHAGKVSLHAATPHLSVSAKAMHGMPTYEASLTVWASVLGSVTIWI